MLSFRLVLVGNARVGTARARSIWSLCFRAIGNPPSHVTLSSIFVHECLGKLKHLDIVCI